MDGANLHLILNHIPILGTLFGALLLLYGLWRDQPNVQTASLGLLALTGLSAIAVYLTGEPAEEIVEELAGVSHDAIEAHEHFAIYALVAGIVTGTAALGTLVAGALRKRLARWSVVLTLVLALVTSGIMIYTANLGGKISHPELRSTQTAAAPPAAATEEAEHR